MNKLISNKGLNHMRKQLKHIYSETTFKNLKILGHIAKKSAIEDNAKFKDLIQLVWDKGILLQAMGKISKNKGALTKGPPTDETTADHSTLKLIDELSKDIKNGTFKFNPIRRKYIDRTGKNPITKEQEKKIIELFKKNEASLANTKELLTRPLGISSFKDKIVQEAIRMILEAIYEPIFSKINVNFGFRNSVGVHDAIIKLKQKAKSMVFAIEGDIKGAFDNVNHDIMIEILRKKIEDEKFLKLILEGLRCGFMFKNFTQEANIATVQGSVCSPLLYNIYFHEFDQYIEKEIKNLYDEKNKMEKRLKVPVNKLYSRTVFHKGKINIKKYIENIKSSYKEYGKDSEEFKRNYQEYAKAKEQYKKLDIKQRQLTYRAKSRQILRFMFVRFADDWVFLTNSNREFAIFLKNKFAEWIWNNLKLVLSEEKTKVTNIQLGELMKFLGFQLTMATNQRIQRVGMKKFIRTDIANRRKKIEIRIDQPKKIHKQRTNNPSLIIAWDRIRVLNRLEEKRFIAKKGKTWRGRSKTEWTTLEVPEIISRYNHIIRGYLEFYGPVTDYASDVMFLHYLLYYSCFHTLAQKLRRSIRDLMKKFSKNLKVNYIIETIVKTKDGTEKNEKIDKSISIINSDQAREIITKRRLTNLKSYREKGKISQQTIIDDSVDNICNITINWRTKYKLSRYCSICGSEKDIEMHHVRHIKIGKVEGFLQVMKQLNRKRNEKNKILFKQN